jgi:hypothetical protein
MPPSREARDVHHGGMSLRWITVFLDFPAPVAGSEVAFWQEVTGYGLSAPRGESGEFATLLPPEGDAYLRVQRVADGPGGCHLDLHVDTASESLDGVASRAVRLGGTAAHRDDDGSLIVMGSPAGLTFCLVRWAGEGTVPGPLVTATGATRLDTLCIDVPPEEFERECSFWSELTGWEAVPAPVPGYSYLERPAGQPLPVLILLQRLDAAPRGQRARAHVDFGCTDGLAIGRHVGLGARVAATHEHWTILNDPAGREYCLVGREPHPAS